MTAQLFLAGRVVLHAGNCLEVLKTIESNSLDSCVTDSPYHLTSIVKRFGADNAAPAKSGKTGAYARASRGFMGKTWDGGDIAFRPELWAEVLRVLKPGAHLLAFSGTRTYHRMACAIEDAGFDIRDMTAWMYGSGFPKSHDVTKGITAREVHGSARTEDIRKLTMGADYVPSGRGRVNYDHGGGSAMNGGSDAPICDAARQWEGWGTALKPALKPIVLARKALDGTVAANVLKHGTGAINIGACRVGTDDRENGAASSSSMHRKSRVEAGYRHDDGVGPGAPASSVIGRWPANVITDGSDEVIESFPIAPGQQQAVGPQHGKKASVNVFGDYGARDLCEPRGDSGSAARFFYSAKADADDRIGSTHPTVKPVDLMQYLVRLITPKGGTTIDPFAGTGTTGEAAWREGMNAVLIEREAPYRDDIARRMALCLAGPDERARASIKARHGDLPAGPLFDLREAAE